MYAIGCLYLIGEFNNGLEISRHDFSHIEDQALFKANLLRLNALFCERLYVQSSSFHYLRMALDATKKALTLFSNEKWNVDSSVHGIAVSHFQLGHIQRLIYEHTKDENYKVEAVLNLKQAFLEFKKINHFLGKF